MKKLLYLGFAALMMLFAMPSVVRAQDGGDEPTPAVTTLTSPTFTPATGSTITPQKEIEFTLPTNLNVADYSGAAFILYVENKPDVTLESDAKILFAAMQAAMNGGGSPMEDDGDTPVASDAPDYEIGIFYSIEEDGSDVMALRPVIISTASGAVAFRARLAVINSSNEVLYSEVMTADYTVEGEVVVVKPTAPTFSLESGPVQKNAKLTLSNGYEGTEASLHPIYYVIDGQESDLTGITTLEELMKKDSYGDEEGITIDKTMTVLAATAEINTTNQTCTWSDVISKTYTIIPNVQITLSANTWDGASDLPKFNVTAPDGITIGDGDNDMAVKVSFYKMDASPEVEFDQYLEAAGETSMENVDNKLTEGVWSLSYSLVKGSDHATRIDENVADVDVAESAMQLTVGTVSATVFATITITPLEWTIGDKDGVMISTSLGESELTFGTTADDVAMLITFTNGETVKKYLVTSNFVQDFNPTTIGLTAGVWTLSYKFGKGNSTVEDFEELDNITASESAPTTLTIVAAEEPAAYFMFNPEPGEIEAGIPITINYSNREDKHLISYMWFATKVEAEAAEYDEETWTEASRTNGITVAKPVLKVALHDYVGTVDADSVVEYEVKALTVSPAPTEEEVEENTELTVTVTAKDNTGAVIYKWYATKAAADADNDFEEYAEGLQMYEDTKLTVTGENPVLCIGYRNNMASDEMEWIISPKTYVYKVKATEKLDVDIEFMTDSYGQARFAKKSDKIRLVLEDYDSIDLYYAIVTDEEAEAEFAKYGEDLISLADVTTNFTVKAYAESQKLANRGQLSEEFSADYVLLDIIEPTLEFEATAAKNYPMEFSVKSISYPDIMDKDMMVYYTLDGETEPSDTSFLNQDGDVVKYLQKQEGIWQNYLELTENTTVWAKAYVMLDEGANLVMETPAVKKDVEINTLENPVITPAVAATEYNAGDSIKVAIEAPEDADVVYYTIDGSEPLFSRTIGNEDLIDSIIFAYYPAWGDDFDTIVVKKSTTVKAIAYKEPAFRMGYVPGAGSDVVSVTFGFKAELTFDPASGSEVYENTTVAINSEDETIDIYYMMFESEEAAKAAEWNQEEAELYGEMQPVITKANTTIKAAYVHAGGTAVTDNFFYATYTVKELPAITLTLNPAAGSEVEENTKVTVTASRELVEGEFIIFKMFATKMAADTCPDDLMLNEGTIYGDPEEDEEFSYPVITKDAPVLKVGALSGMDENGEWIYNWIVAEYKVKGVATEANELAGVRIYPNPTEGEFNVVAPADAQVEIFNAAGVVVKRATVVEGAAQVRLNNSGIYFVRVIANGEVAIRKVVIR